MNVSRQTRARITERDATYLAFLAKFPAADSEALSYLTVRESNPFGAEAGQLTAPSGIDKRFQKLIKLGAATKFRNPISGTNHYGITALGHEAALFYNHDIPVWRTTEGLSISRLEHYKNIALVAAQLLSPVPQFTKELNMNSVSSDQIISENQMRAAYESVNKLLKTQTETGTDFGSYRKSLSSRIIEDVKAGKLNFAEVLTYYPALWTIGTVKNSASKMKPIHQPDIAINLDSTRRGKANNLLIEVELSAKSPAEYERILRTFKHEFNSGTAYARAVYFVNISSTAKLIKRMDEVAETNLIKSKQLVIIPIRGRNNERKTPINRVVVPKGAPAKVVGDGLPNFNELV